jgi:lysophospholipase
VFLARLPQAPFYQDVADGPRPGVAYWLTASDEVRIRLGVWKKGKGGTAIIFPGRTECIEKYGRTAKLLAKRGLSSVAIDWRGQGLSDRLTSPRSLGHVGKFADYQLDVLAVLDALDVLDMPKPWFLIAHSMGGAIGLRSLHNRLPVEKSVFTAPMWDIEMNPNPAADTFLRPVTKSLEYLTKSIGYGSILMPTTSSASYVTSADFADNTLTSDKAQWTYMRDQNLAYPGLDLGGPSVHWVDAAIREGAELQEMTPPAVPCLTFLGLEEAIVSPLAIIKVMAKWPTGELITITGGRHEVLMENPAILARVYAKIDAFLGLQ